MGTYTQSNSPVFGHFFDPILTSYPGSQRHYDCAELTDLDFLEMRVSRCLSESRTGRDFLQRHGDNGRKDVAVDLLFKALKSGRRLTNASSVNDLLAEPMAAGVPDPFASVGELDGFALYAGDGHYHGAASHDPASLSSRGILGKRPPQHFFIIYMRNIDA